MTFILESFEQKINRVREISIEATPDSLTFAKIKRLKSIGFNRISIGIQTFNQRILNRVNRKHSINDFYRAYDWTRLAGFDNVNIDLLYGLPFQTFNCFKRDLEISTALDPEHMTVSSFHSSGQALVSPRYFKRTLLKRIRWSKYAYEFLENKGYKNYYHKYFSKKGKEFISELIYRYCHSVIAIGAGAENKYCVNKPDIGSYIANPYPSNLFFYKNKGYYEEREERLAFSLMTNLFRSLLFPEGLCISHFNKKYNCDIEKSYKNVTNMSSANEYPDAKYRGLFPLSLAKCPIYDQLGKIRVYKPQKNNYSA